MKHVNIRRLVGYAIVLTLLLSPASGTAAQFADPPLTPPSPQDSAQDPTPLDQVDTLVMPPVDNQALLDEEAATWQPGTPPRFAIVQKADVTPAQRGTWELMEGDQLLWRLRIQSPGAVSLNLGFARYAMPEGGQLRIYATDGSASLRPFTAADNDAHGELWTPILPSDDIVVAVQVPAAVADQLELVLESVNHGFTEFGRYPQSGSCNLDVVCGAGDGYPQVDAWRDEIRSVARITSVSGPYQYSCTGALMNNTAQDLTPYFLTADHCEISATNAATVVAYWNYENSWCRPPGSPASGQPGDGSLSQFNTGAIFRADYFPTDMTLLELDDPINPSFNVYYAGWDRTNSDATSAVAIHHPVGEEFSGVEKRISFENDPTSTTSYLQYPVPGDGTHIRVTDWDLGTTETGSSGSPLFNPDGRVVGQLHGGDARCDNDESDWYGRLSVSWNGGGSNSTRLRNWLDPLNTGPTVLDGLDPDFTLSVTPEAREICVPTNATYHVQVVPGSGFASPVTLSAAGHPAGTTTSFIPNPATSPGYSSNFTIGNTGAAAAGNYTVNVTGTAEGNTIPASVQLRVFRARPATPTLIAPANSSIVDTTSPTFSWSSVAQATGYTIQIASDASFNNVASVTVDGTSYSGATLSANSTFYWRVLAKNVCGDGTYSQAWSFRTAGAPGACGPGQTPRTVWSDDFESGAPGWITGGTGSTWARGAGVSPSGPHSGQFVYHGDNVSSISDQYLVSPAINLPSGQAPMTLQFWNYQEMEDRNGGCFDGGVLEVTSNNGATWTRLESQLLTDPYDGPISASFENPLGGQNAWCGDPQDWLNSIVDIDAFAGQTVRFRWRLATDRSVGKPGWDIDDVVVQSCRSGTAPNIDVQPLSMFSRQRPNTTALRVLSIGNTGGDNLSWMIEEEDTTSSLGAALTVGDASVAAELGDASVAAEVVDPNKVPGNEPQSAPERSPWAWPEAVLYNNGPLVNGFGTGVGGADESILQNISLGMEALGFNHQVSAGFRIADDFTVSDPEGWDVDTITFFGYQTGSSTASTFTVVNLQIWDGPPNDPGSSVVFGDTTTNRMTSSIWSNIYRADESTSGTASTRPIMANTVAVETYLPAGTYWLDWMADGTLTSGPWAPPITINGQATTGNALQYNSTTSTWSAVIDEGSGTPQGFPFIIQGVDCDAPSNIPWLSLNPTSGSTAPGNTSRVTVTLNAMGLTQGTYSGNLCVVSNDPDPGPGNGTELVVVPVTMIVDPTVMTRTTWLPLLTAR